MTLLQGYEVRYLIGRNVKAKDSFTIVPSKNRVAITVWRPSQHLVSPDKAGNHKDVYIF